MRLSSIVFNGAIASVDSMFRLSEITPVTAAPHGQWSTSTPNVLRSFTVASVAEKVSARSCPQANSPNRCLQIWRVELYSTPACQFDGTYAWSFDIGCAPGGDCSRIDPALTTFSFNATHASENFCSVFQPLPFAPFRPTLSVLLPISGVRPFTTRLFTTINEPYVLTNGSVVPPQGMSSVSFMEAGTSPQCDADAGICRHWWDQVVDPGTQCSPRGSYTLTFNVGCRSGGNCDPNITSWQPTVPLSLDQPNQCPDGGP